MTRLQWFRVSSHNSVMRPPQLTKTESSDLALVLSQCLMEPCRMTYKGPCFPIFISFRIFWKLWTHSSPPNVFAYMCTPFFPHTILWSSRTLSKPKCRYCHLPPGQGPWMSAGLLGSKEDGVFSDQLHSTLKKTELSSKQITNHSNY